MTRKIQLLLLLISVTFTLSACTISFESSSSSDSRANGGVYKSMNSGDTWTHITGIAAVSGKVLNFSNENVIALTIDPQDNTAIYAGTEAGGMMFSYDSGASWSVARNLGKRKVQSIAVSPADKCVIFAASENKIFKSVDCNRNWSEIYFDNNKTVAINSLIFDPSNANFIYAGTSRGEIIASANAGQSWTVIKRFADARREADNTIVKVAINAHSRNIIWVATSASGIYKSEDGGLTWKSFTEEFMEINTKNANKINDIMLSPSNNKIIIVATSAGMIRSFDNGDHWQLVDLIPPAAKTVINKVDVFVNDEKRIYYITDTSLGWSEDSGSTWSSKKLPTSRRGVSLIVDSKDPTVIYIGVKALEKK